MELRVGATRIYSCPMCQVDTPHTVRGRRGEVYVAQCSNCAGGSLVQGDDLQAYQVRWESELQEMLDRLGTEGRPGEEDG